MKLIRMVFLALAVLLPTSWTLAHADDMKDSGGEMKPAKKKKDKKEKGDKGDMGGDKKGDMEKK